MISTLDELLALIDGAPPHYRTVRPNKPKDMIMRESLPEKAYKRWRTERHDMWFETTDAMPFQVYTLPVLDVEYARSVLDSHIVGREKEKSAMLYKYTAYCTSGRLRRPILLVGEPGCGKSRFAKAFGEMMGLKTRYINVPSLNAPLALIGSEQHYSNCRVGILVKTLVEFQSLSAVFVFDEVEKAARGGSDASIESVLLQIFDPTWSSAVIDRCLEYPVDFSRCPMICTANDLNDLSEPMRDRFDIIRFEPYTLEQLREIIITHSIPHLTAEYGMTGRLAVADDTVDRLLETIGTSSMRAYENALEKLLDFGVYSICCRDNGGDFIITPEHLDVIGISDEGRSKYGFGVQ